MKAPKSLIALAGALAMIIVVLLAVLLFYNPAKAPTAAPVRPVVSADGHLSVWSLHPGDSVSSPLTITGSVTGGGWFFEASFPVKVMDAHGAVLGSGIAQAQADWTSTGTVPFTAIVQFSAPPGAATGTVVLSKDDPSGAPQNAESLDIPVDFK